jgi:hypothetical protein
MCNTDPTKTEVNAGSHESKQFPSFIKIITAATMQQILLYKSIELKHIMYGTSYVQSLVRSNQRLENCHLLLF